MDRATISRTPTKLDELLSSLHRYDREIEVTKAKLVYLKEAGFTGFKKDESKHEAVVMLNEELKELMDHRKSRLDFLSKWKDVK